MVRFDWFGNGALVCWFDCRLLLCAGCIWLVVYVVVGLVVWFAALFARCDDTRLLVLFGCWFAVVC